MQELLPVPDNFAADPISAHPTRRWAMFGVRVVFWPVVLLTLVALALEFGAYQREFKIAGPFEREAGLADHSLVLAVPLEGRAVWWRQPLLGDDDQKPFRSFVELYINGREMGPPHSLYETIRSGRTAGFKHWGPDIIFSLPSGVKNSRETIATLRYDVRPRTSVIFTLIFSAALLGWLQYHRALRSLTQPYEEQIRAALFRAPYLILLGFCGVGLIGSVVYATSSLYALATGWALPTTALIRWSPIASWAVENERYFGYAIVTCAGLGAASTWLVGSNSRRQQSVESDERLLRRALLWCGLPIAASAFVLGISAMWVGMSRPGDLNYANIGGLIPFSDAFGYLAAAHDQAKDGIWNTIALRRPLAAAFRSVLLFFSGDSLQSMLILQTCLLAAAACFAAYAVAIWRGIWAGAAFFGLTYIYDRTFVATTLTEPLGLFWALLSIPFFIDAFRRGSVRPALIAFAMTVVALMTRMGSMFTIPALLLWLVWQFGQGAAAKFRICAVAFCILLGVFGLNALLQKAYGTGHGSTGGNFAYTLCGLTIGTGWEGCVEKAASEGKHLSGDEEVAARQLYSMAGENFLRQPGIFFGRLADGAEEFITKLPETMWGGFTKSVEEQPWLQYPLTTVSLIGLFYIAARRAKSVEWTFWALFWPSTVLSASIVYFDDGARVLAVSYPLIALFFAMGVSSPAVLSTEGYARGKISQYGAWGLLFAAALFVCVPWMAHSFSPIDVPAGDNLLPKHNDVLVFGGRRMSGFLVVEDDMALRSDVPMIHLEDFAALIERSGVEGDQGLLHPVMPALPFGFVFAPRHEKGVSTDNQFIVPPQVIERRDVPVWRFQLTSWHHKPGEVSNYWFYVTKAEPWSKP